MAINFFELLKLKPFPRLPSKEDILDAAKKWEKEGRRIALSSGFLYDRKKELNELLRTLPGELQVFASDPEKQIAQQNEFRDRHCAKLKEMAEYMKKISGFSIRDALVRRMAWQIGLNYPDVKKVFTDAGFEIINSEKTAQVVCNPEDLAFFQVSLLKLQNALKMNVPGIPPKIAGIRTLYEYLDVMLEFLGKDKVDHKDNGAVRAAFEELSRVHTLGTEPQVFFRNIESQAFTDIFKDEAAKQRYDRYIRLNESGLIREFQLIADYLGSARAKPKFARDWISNVQSVLECSEEEAYRAYNQLCKIPPDEALEKEDPQVCTVCACGFHNIHESLAEALRSKCNVCGKPLYAKCPVCGEKTHHFTNTRDS